MGETKETSRSLLTGRHQELSANKRLWLLGCVNILLWNSDFLLIRPVRRDQSGFGKKEKKID